MVRILKVKINKKISKTVKGFVVKFPKELIGVVPVKEYLHAIEIINSNSIRHFYTYYIYSIFVGLFPIIFFWLVNHFRWKLFKNQVKNDLKPVIGAINRSMSIRGVTFKIKFKDNLKLIISYPDNVTLPIPDNTINIDGKTAILLDAYFEPQPLIQNPRSFKQFNEPIDINLKSLKISNGQTTNYSGTKPFKKRYDNQFYNYLSNDEYNSMIDDYNVNIASVPFNSRIAKFFLISKLLFPILIGFILFIPAIIMYNEMIAEYNLKIDKLFVELDAKYNALYNQRGISFSTIRPFPQINKINQNFIFPRDVGYGPVLTKLTPSNKLVLAQSVPGGIAPNYQSIQQQPQVPLYTFN